MKLSKTSEYAIRILSFMINSDKQVFTAKYLVEQLKMPDKYLRRIMTDLSKDKFIRSIRGRDGGYVFAKDANKIFLINVINSVEGIGRYTGCVLGFDKCSNENPCSLHTSYSPIRNEMISFLSVNTIADLKDSKILKF